MDFELLDGYLLKGSPSKREVVARLIAGPSPSPQSAPFYQGIALLGERVPDLSLIALRLVEAGHRAEDETVVRLRGLVERARREGPDAERARAEYSAFFNESSGPSGVEC